MHETSGDAGWGTPRGSGPAGAEITMSVAENRWSDRWASLSWDQFPHHDHFQTRWSDNDSYRHLNNAVHYNAVDSAVNRMLLGGRARTVDFAAEEVPLVVASAARYFRESSYPMDLRVGLAVTRLGSTSVTYLGGLFTDDEPEPAMISLVAFTHVYVARDSRFTVPVPTSVRSLIEPLIITEKDS